MLPWWIEYGAIIGWVVVACGASLAIAIGARARRRRLHRAADARLVDLGAPTSPLAASGVATVRGRLRGRGERRLERPEDGAPCLAFGVILAMHFERSRFEGRCEAVDAVDELELELDSGERVRIEGRLELVLGSSESERPRRRQVLPAAIGARIATLIAPLALEPQAIMAFRSLQDGDVVLARGTMESTPSKEGAAYRSAAADRTLRDASDDGCVRLAFASAPRLQWDRRWRVVVHAVIGAALALGVVAGGGALSDWARPDAYAFVPAESGYRYRPPFGAPHWSYALGAMSPVHRRDALAALASEYANVAPMDEQHARAAVRALRLQSCEAALSWLLERGHYEEVARDTACDERFAAEHRFRALLALGRYEDAAGVAERSAGQFDAVHRARVYVVLSRWHDALDALRERELFLSELPTDEWREERLARLRCLRAAIRARAGETSADHQSTADDASACALTAADLRPPGERGEILGDLESLPQSERYLGALLLLEGGEAFPGRHWWVSGNAFMGPSQYTLEYTGLHAAALQSYDRRRASGPNAMAARLGADQAVFEVWTGDISRAERIARRALARGPENRFDPTSVLVLAHLRRRDVAGARAQYVALHPSQREIMERWVRLLGLRDASRMEPNTSADPYREAAIAGDGARLARLVSVGYGGGSELPLLASLVRDDREVLIEAHRWSRVHREYAPRHMLAEWAAARWTARELGDAAGERRAARMVRRFRAIVLRRDTALLLTSLERS